MKAKLSNTVLGGLAAVLWLGMAPALHAGVDVAQWDADSLEQIISRSARDEKPMLVVITQPDWCPPCIELEQSFLGNPDAVDLHDLTADWTVIEIAGYDEEGAAVLRQHDLKFPGTPTTYLLQPSKGDRRLGDCRKLTSIVGAPEDFTERLRRAAAGDDSVRAAQDAARTAGTVEAFQELADAYIMSGESRRAQRTLMSVLARDDLEADTRRETEWKLIIEVHQRLDKNHEGAIAEIDAFGRKYPDQVGTEDYSYWRAWSLLALHRVEEARTLMQAAFLDADEADATAEYLYLVFRSPVTEILAEAEGHARRALATYPDQQARFQAALGRILRREGRLQEAADAFARAVELTDEDDAGRRQTYLGQLQFVRRQLAAGG